MSIPTKIPKLHEITRNVGERRVGRDRWARRSRSAQASGAPGGRALPAMHFKRRTKP